MTSSYNATPGRGCPWQSCRIDARSEAQVHATARRGEFGKRPSAGAVAWLVGLCEAADLEVRAEARNAAGVARVKG